MNPKDYTVTWLQAYFEKETDKKHSMAVKYIEENIDLVDTDLQKFLDDCPRECVSEVYAMLQKAGIDMQDVIKDSVKHKQWENYVYDIRLKSHLYYTIDDYKQKFDKYTTMTIDWGKTWASDCVVYDTIFDAAEG